MILSELLIEGENILKKANILNFKKEAKILISNSLNIEEYEFYINQNKIIKINDLNKIILLLKKRAQNQPYEYLLNTKYFFDLQFYIDKNVLIPRCETEHIIENVLNKINKNTYINIIDLGVGSGAILLSLLYHLPNAYGVGIDISIEALKVAKKNIYKYGLNNRCSLINGNWAESVKPNYFDILICNPPYIDEKHIKNLDAEVKYYEPLIALNGGKEGLEPLNNLLPSARLCLKKKSLAYFEIGYNQSEKAQNLIKKNNFKIKSVIKDLSQYERILLAETK